MSGSQSLPRYAALALVTCLSAALYGCASQPAPLPAVGSGDLAVGVSGYQRAPRAETDAPAHARAFPREDARTALAAARRGLLACRQAETPASLAATLEFSPSGRVQRVDVDPADGPLADCIRADLKEVEIPRFDGPPVEMQLRVEL